jgi:hypothetical protein
LTEVSESSETARAAAATDGVAAATMVIMETIKTAARRPTLALKINTPQ